MKSISLPYTRVFQGICVAISVLLVFFFFRYWMSNVRNHNSLLILIIAVVLLVIINSLYIRLREVYVGRDKIIVRNLFQKECIERAEFVAVTTMFVSPFIYKISFKNGRSYYFMINSDIMIKEIVTLEAFNAIDKLNENIREGRI